MVAGELVGEAGRGVRTRSRLDLFDGFLVVRLDTGTVLTFGDVDVGVGILATVGTRSVDGYMSLGVVVMEVSALGREVDVNMR